MHRKYMGLGASVLVALGCNGAGSSSPGGASTAATTSSTAATTSTTTAPVTSNTASPLTVSLGPKTPAAATVQAGATQVPALQAQVAAWTSGPQLLVTGVVVGVSGANAAKDVSTVSLVLDTTGAGQYVAGSSTTPLLGTVPLSSTGTATFNANTMPPLLFQTGATGNFLVLLSFAQGAPSGDSVAATIAGSDMTVTNAVTQSPLTATGVVRGATLTVGGGVAGPGTWAVKPSMLTPRMKLMAAADNGGKVYAIGGRIVTGSVNNNEALDTATMTWKSLLPMPTARILGGAAFVNGIVYVAGGSPDGITALATVEGYDVATNSWQTLAALPHARYGLSVVALNGKIWAIGGTDGVANYMGADVYDPGTNTWTTPIPNAGSTNGDPSAVGNGNIFLFGSASILWGPGTNAFATWTPASYTCPPAAAAAAIGNFTYIIGGESSAGVAVGTVTAFDATQAGTGSGQAVAPLGTARRNAAALTASNGKIYCVGGFNGGAQALGVVEEFTP